MKVNKLIITDSPHALCWEQDAPCCVKSLPKSYIIAYLSSWDVSLSGTQWPGDTNSRLVNTHSRTKAAGRRLQVQQAPLAAIITGKVPVHLLKITVKAVLQIGGGVNYVSRVRTRSSRLHAHSPRRSVKE